MANITIEAMLSSLGGTKEEWDLVEVPIPEGLLVYTTDTGDFKLGNGIDRYIDLPVFFNAGNMESVNQLYNSLPNINDAIPGKFIIVNPEGDGYILSDITIGQVVTTIYLSNALNDKIAKNHTHTSDDITNIKSAALRNVGTNPGDVPDVQADGKLDPVVVPVVTGDSLDNDKILSYLVLAQMVDDDTSKLNLPNGFADEFYDETGIYSTENAAFTIGQYSGTNMTLVSKNTTTEEAPLTIKIFIRCEVSDPVNNNLLIDVSRDGRATWTSVALEESKLSGDTIRIFTGIADMSNAPTGTEIAYRIQGGASPLTTHGIYVKWV